VKVGEDTVVLVHRVRALFVGVVAGVLVAGMGPSTAQTSSNHPNSSGVAQQFKSGADRVGEGATQIGEGIKQGAIMTWEAIKAGASAAAAKFNGGHSAPTTNKGAAQSNQQSH
jgi:hypothetical protein